MSPIPPTHCVVCRTPLTPLQRYDRGLCANWRCRERSLEIRLETHRGHAAAAGGVEHPEEYLPVVVPDHRPPLAPVPRERVEELREHLDELVARSFEEEPDVPPDPAAGEEAARPGPAALGRICGACEGACCRYGLPRHAFVDEGTIRRYRSRRPEAKAEEIVADYLSRVPGESVRDSCVFHGPAGCVLPRTIRGDVCNTHECPGLKRAREAFDEHGTTRFFVVRREDHEIRGSVFVDGPSGARARSGDGRP